MVDFLREHAWCSPEQYKWGLTVAQVRLMSYDFTHMEYLDKGKSGNGNTVRIGGVDDLGGLSGLGIPSISRPNT